jgi:uncharacterized protein YutE (UPF0331/DUF86 family)
MAPDVMTRKLQLLRQYVEDLSAHRGADIDYVLRHHYEIERLFELLVAVASDLLFHELGKAGITPSSYRDAFRLAGDQGILPRPLAESLALAAGMRNILVHLYDEIDYEILRDSIESAISEFQAFIRVFEKSLGADEAVGIEAVD